MHEGMLNWYITDEFDEAHQEALAIFESELITRSEQAHVIPDRREPIH
jgi:hypothetical protein